MTTSPIVVQQQEQQGEKKSGPAKKHGRKRTVNVQLYNNEYEYSRATMKKMKSKRKGRRFENLCHLLSLFTDDIWGDDYDLDDLADFSQNSLFYQLFQNDAYLQKWYKFLAKTGEEQDVVLDELDKLNSSVGSSSDESILDESSCGEDESGREEDDDENSIDRLEFGDNAFNKIDKNIKPVLKRQYSLQYLLKYENQIIPVFESNKTSEHCIGNMENSIERMIVHGLCQYLDIKSKSYRDNQQGTILKMIKTNDGKFLIPPILLSEFLRERFFSSSSSSS